MGFLLFVFCFLNLQIAENGEVNSPPAVSVPSNFSTTKVGGSDDGLASFLIVCHRGIMAALDATL